MYRAIVALLLLIASVAGSSAQGLFPSAWQSQSGAILKVLRVDPAGNFSGVFISSPRPPCPAVPYDLAGRVSGLLVAFRTSRTWTADCNVTAVWTGRFVNPDARRRLPPTGGSSTLFDLEAGRRLEREALVGAVVAEGERLGVPVPASRACDALLRLLSPPG